MSLGERALRRVFFDPGIHLPCSSEEAPCLLKSCHLEFKDGIGYVYSQWIFYVRSSAYDDIAGFASWRELHSPGGQMPSNAAMIWRMCFRDHCDQTSLIQIHADNTPQNWPQVMATVLCTT